jgi:hypothetical protein
MAKKISSSDLFEQEDLFKGVRDSASKTLAVFNELQAELKATAQGLKTELAANTQASTAQLKQFSAASEQANKLMQQAVQIEKLKAQADQQKIKAEQEIVKLQKMQAQETARLAKEQEKAAKLAANEASAYSKLSKELSGLKRRYQDLAVQNQENTAEGKELLDTITKLDSQLKKVDATVGNHYRNVGNYEGATKSLKLQLRELTQALQNMDESDPRFQQMAQQAGELRDRIQDTQGVIKATAGTAIENLGGAMATAGQVGVAAFQGVESAMVLAGVESENVVASIAKLQALAGLSDALGVLGGIGDQLTKMSAGFTAFGSKAIGAFNGMTTAGKAFAVTGIGLIITALGYAVANWDKLTAAMSSQTAAQKVSNEVTKQAIQTISGELSAADKLSKQLKDETLTREEKIKKVKEFQASYPGLLQNMNLETMSIDQINTQLTKNIELLKLQAKAKAIQAIREDNYKKILENNIDLMSGKATAEFEFLGIDLGVVTTGEDAANGILGFVSASEAAGLITSKTNKEIQKNIDLLDKEDKANAAAMLALEKKGAQNSGIIKDYSKLSAAGGGYNQTLQQQVDLLSQIQDEQIKAIKDENQRAQTQLIVEAERRKNEVTKTVANAQQKAALIKEIEANLITDLDKLDAEYYQKKEQDEKELLEKQIAQAEWYRQNKEDIAEKERQDNIKLFNDSMTQEDKQNQAKLASLDGEQKKEFEERLAFQKELEALNQLKFDGAFASQEEYEKAVENLKKKYQADDIEKAKKLEEEKWKTTQDFAQKATDFLKKQSEERISLIDKEISAAEKQADIYRELAANGNINAQQSLAEQERIIAEGNRRKEREQKRQQRLELANTIYQTYASHAAKDPKTALMNTIKDASLLQAFISSLPMFYDGTEDTGAGGGVDGKGGFHAVLHPHERVIPKSLNDQIGNLTNEQLTRLAMEYQNGRLVGQDVAHSSMDLAILASKLDNLTDVIKHKPETNIQLGEITQSAMEIVQSTRKGNTTVYNRFKVRK